MSVSRIRNRRKRGLHVTCMSWSYTIFDTYWRGSMTDNMPLACVNTNTHIVGFLHVHILFWRLTSWMCAPILLGTILECPIFYIHETLLNVKHFNVWLFSRMPDVESWLIFEWVKVHLLKGAQPGIFVWVRSGRLLKEKSSIHRF